MSSEAVFNNPVGLVTLSPVAIGDTVIALNQVVGAANTQFRLKIGAEIVVVTNGGGTATVTVTRGQENTAPNSYPAGMAVKLDLTAGGLINYISQTIAGTPSSGVQSVGAGSHVTVTGTASNPIVNASGVVQSVTAGTNVTVTGTTANPIINASGGSGPTAPYFNVKDYGAKGDGSTDDTVAIQNASNAASGAQNNTGGVVWFPAGQYLVTGQLVSASEWLGSGASDDVGDGVGSQIIYKGTDGDDALTYSGAKIEGIGFFNQTTGAVTAGVNCIFAQVVGSCRIADCTFQGFTKSAVGGEDSLGASNYRFTVERNMFISCSIPAGGPDAGIVVWKGRGGGGQKSITGNLFKDCTNAETPGGLIFVEDAHSSNFTIAENQMIGGTAANGVYVAADSSPIHDYYAIVGNNFTGASTAVNDNGTGTHKTIQTGPMKWS